LAKVLEVSMLPEGKTIQNVSQIQDSQIYFIILVRIAIKPGFSQRFQVQGNSVNFNLSVQGFRLPLSCWIFKKENR
jgi:hypothetical protein